MYTKTTGLPNLYIRNIIPDNMSIPLPEHLALSGRGYAELRIRRILRSSPIGDSRKFVSRIVHSPSPIQVATDGSKDAELAATSADLVMSTGSELHIFHVGPVVPEHFEPTDVEPARMEQEARRVLEEQVTKIKNLGGTAVQAHLRMGGAAEKVVALAEGLGVGPVILCSSSRSDHGV